MPEGSKSGPGTTNGFHARRQRNRSSANPAAYSRKDSPVSYASGITPALRDGTRNPFPPQDRPSGADIGGRPERIERRTLFGSMVVERRSA